MNDTEDDPYVEVPYDEPWQRPDVESKSVFIEADDGVRLHYYEWPADEGAPVVLLVHGRRAHANWFDAVAPELSPRYRCICPDLRGHGESEAKGPTDLKRYAQDLAMFVEKFRDERVALMAHSFAGRLAIMARQYYDAEPDLLVLADAPIFRRPHHDLPEAPMRPKQYPDAEFAISRFRLMPPNCSGSEELLLHIAEKSVKQNEDGTWGWRFDEGATVRAYGDDFPDAEDLAMGAFDCPTLVLYGQYSDLISPEEAEATAEAFKNAELVGLGDTFHHLMLDRPKKFTRALLNFFGKHDF